MQLPVHVYEPASPLSPLRCAPLHRVPSACPHSHRCSASAAPHPAPSDRATVRVGGREDLRRAVLPDAGAARRGRGCGEVPRVRELLGVAGQPRLGCRERQPHRELAELKPFRPEAL